MIIIIMIILILNDNNNNNNDNDKDNTKHINHIDNIDATRSTPAGSSSRRQSSAGPSAWRHDGSIAQALIYLCVYQ